MTERTTTIRPDSERESPGLLSLLASLPCVSQVVQAVSTFNIGPVTEVLKRAAYFPLVLAAPSFQGMNVFEVAGELRRLDVAAEEGRSGYVGRNRVGDPAADVRFRWRFVPEDYPGDPVRRQPLPASPFQPGISQRIEVFDWELRFRDGVSGFRAYGVGRTLPGVGAASPAAGLAFVLEILEGYGQLAGRTGTVVASGALAPHGGLELGLIVRMLDPAATLLTQEPPRPVPPGAAPEPGVTWLALFGEVDPDNPVTLRLSLSEGILGSNVYERLRVADLDFDVGLGSGLRGRAREGPYAGALRAELDFNPLDPRPVTPIQTRKGVFELRDQAGRRLGSLASNMIEGRSFRTRLTDMLLPVFRFAGFGPVTGGTGGFAGARGIMTMNSIISVQPRTLSNLYILRLDDPNGRFRATAQGAFGGWAS
jgi:hypothetical protein